MINALLPLSLGFLTLASGKVSRLEVRPQQEALLQEIQLGVQDGSTYSVENGTLVNYTCSPVSPGNVTDYPFVSPHYYEQTYPGPEDVEVTVLPTDKDGSIKMITPKSNDQKSLPFLMSFMEHNRGWINDMIVASGAVIFRGFDVSTAQDVEDAVLAFEPEDLSNIYRGTSPRHAQGGTEYVFSAAEGTCASVCCFFVLYSSVGFQLTFNPHSKYHSTIPFPHCPTLGNVLSSRTTP